MFLNKLFCIILLNKLFWILKEYDSSQATIPQINDITVYLKRKENTFLLKYSSLKKTNKKPPCFSTELQIQHSKKCCHGSNPMKTAGIYRWSLSSFSQCRGLHAFHYWWMWEQSYFFPLIFCILRNSTISTFSLLDHFYLLSVALLDWATS